MKAIIYVVDNLSESQRALKIAAEKALKKGLFRVINEYDAWDYSKNRRKYVLYQNEVDLSTKSVIFQITNGFDFSYFMNIEKDNNEFFNVLRVERPYLSALKLHLNLFFISLGYPKFLGKGASVKNRFEIIDLRNSVNNENPKNL